MENEGLEKTASNLETNFESKIVDCNGRFKPQVGFHVISKLENDWKSVDINIFSSKVIKKYFVPIPYPYYRLTILSFYLETDSLEEFLRTNKSVLNELKEFCKNSTFIPTCRVKNLYITGSVGLELELTANSKINFEKMRVNICSILGMESVNHTPHISLAYKYKEIKKEDASTITEELYELKNHIEGLLTNKPLGLSKIDLFFSKNLADFNLIL